MQKNSRQIHQPTSTRKLRIWRFCLVLLCSLALASCSSTKLAYEYLDWVAMWKIDRMVDLDSKQRDRAKAAVRSLHDWHRTHELPRYAEHIEALQARLNPGSVTGEQLHAETDEIQILLDVSVAKAIPLAADIIATLSGEQVQGLLENIEEERQEYIDEYITPGEEKRQEKNVEKFQDTAKRFIGRLTDEQEHWVKAWSRELVPYTHLSAKQQQIWEEHLAKYLALRKNRPLLEKGLRELMLYRSDNWDPELQAVVDQNQAITYELIARILNSLTPKQRQHLDKTLRDFVKDFRELAQKG